MFGFTFGSGNNPSDVKTAIDFFFFAEFDGEQLPGLASAENPVLFRQSSIDRGSVISEEYMGPGEWDQHDEDEERDIATVRTGNQITRDVLNFKKTLKIPIELFEDDLHGLVEQATRDVGRTGRFSRDKYALQRFPEGFSAVTTNDAVAWWSNSHTALNGGTVDNLETGALSAANLETLVRRLIEQPTQDGSWGGHNPAALLVPPILFPDALEITKSQLQAGTGNNNLNYWSMIYPGLQVLQSPLIGSTYSTVSSAQTAHYVVSKNHGCFRWVRVPVNTQMVPPDTDDRDRYTYKARFRELVAPVTWEGAVASNGTA